MRSEKEQKSKDTELSLKAQGLNGEDSHMCTEKVDRCYNSHSRKGAKESADKWETRVFS